MTPKPRNSFIHSPKMNGGQGDKRTRGCRAGRGCFYVSARLGGREDVRAALEAAENSTAPGDACQQRPTYRPGNDILTSVRTDRGSRPRHLCREFPQGTTAGEYEAAGTGDRHLSAWIRTKHWYQMPQQGPDPWLAGGSRNTHETGTPGLPHRVGRLKSTWPRAQFHRDGLVRPCSPDICSLPLNTIPYFLCPRPPKITHTNTYHPSAYRTTKNGLKQNLPMMAAKQ